MEDAKEEEELEENGLRFEDPAALEGLTPKRDAPKSGFGCAGVGARAGSAVTAAGGAAVLDGSLLARVARNPLILPSFRRHVFLLHPSK